MIHKAALLVTASLLAAPAVAQAQDVSSATRPDQAQTAPSRTSLDDIVVTATRRSVNLQTVSATIEAVPALTLKALNVNSVLQLPSLVSGLIVSPSGGNNLFMRGIGSASTGFNEAQTAVYIDGLYLANPTAGIYSFNNIDRVEVLKGPQGTLYGRNVTGGLISVITRDPGTEARVDASLGYASYDNLTANVYAAAPLGSNLSANIAVYHQNQRKGWSTNTFTGQDVQTSKETGLQTKLQWRPGADTKVTASFIYDHNDRNVGYAYQVAPGTVGTDGTVYLGDYLTTSRIQPSAPTDIYIGSIKVEQELGFAHFMSLTGYQTSHADVLFGGGLGILGKTVSGQGATYNQFYERNKTWSQEFQLTSSPSSSGLEWVAGAFYYNDHTKLQLDSYNTCIGAVCAPGLTPNRNTGYPATESLSAYGDITHRFLTATKLTVGLRYTDETKTLKGLASALPGFPNSVAALPAAATATTAGTVYSPGDPFPGFPTGIPTRLHFEKLTYRFVLAQDIGENIHLYASHNLGFKSGAFNGNSFTNPPARPELLYATELGMKSELLDRRVRLNLAYFHYTYKDVQVRSLVPPALPGNPILQNAAKEKMDGVDGDFSVALLPGLRINGSFEYLDARYADFPGTTCATIGTRVVNGVTVGNVTSVTCNLAGNKVIQAAPFSASLGFTYTLDTGRSGTFMFSANDHYNSPYPFVADGNLYQQRHHVVDASLNWTDASQRFDINLYVRNLTDEHTFGNGQQTGANFTVIPGAPRIFGATVGLHF